MIKFIPVIKHVSSPLADINSFVSNKTNTNLAERLEKMLMEKHCELHPSFENIIEVHFQDEGEIMTVKTFCCKDFKSTLDSIANNKNPFPKSE